MKNFIFVMTLFASITSFADCTLYIAEQPREDEQKLHNICEMRHNKNLDKAERTLKKAMRRKGFKLVDKVEDARFFIPEFNQTCGYSQMPLEEQECEIGFGKIKLVDDIDPKNSKLYAARDVGIELSSSFHLPIMQSASGAFKKTLAQIPHCEL